MKMRRMRVRSLLAGCISWLRCVRTSALTCRSSPLCVASPRFAVPRSSRCYYDHQNHWFPQQPISSRDARFRESSLCILELVARCLSPLRSLFIAATDRAGHQAPDTQHSRPVQRTRVNPHRGVTKTLPAPPRAAVDALDRK